MNVYEKIMDYLGADGIDFVSDFKEKEPYNIIATYTKESFKNIATIPKTNYHFWHYVNGRKIYFTHQQQNSVIKIVTSED